MAIAAPTDDFLLLAATLIAQFPSSSTETLNDGLLLQLQAMFGSMLMSALQLVDRREVVRIALPTGRTIWQVTSSTGLPYTLNMSLPDTTSNPPAVADPEYAYNLADCLQGMYCPCTGFAYNSISGDRNYFASCKHLLAVVLAHQMGREISTEVIMPGVVGLLGLNRDEVKLEKEAGVKEETI